MSKYLFIESHIDDATLCCGGTITKLLELGNEVSVLCLSREYSGVDLIHEWLNTMMTLGPTFYSCLKMEVRMFHKNSNEILQMLYKQTEYDYVFTHSPYCLHSDHAEVGKASVRVFKNTNLITYIGPWNTRKFVNNYFVELESKHIEKKVNALSHFKSQQDKTYMHPDFIYANALNNGVMIGRKYAEAFQSINLIQ